MCTRVHSGAITAAENWSMSTFVGIQKMVKMCTRRCVSGVKKTTLQSRFFIYPRRSLMLHCLFARRFSLLQSKPLYECMARNSITCCHNFNNPSTSLSYSLSISLITILEKIDHSVSAYQHHHPSSSFQFSNDILNTTPG